MLYQLMKDNGFSILNNHSMDLSLLENFYDLWSTFFISNEKYKYHGDLSIPVGYLGSIKNNIVTNHEDFYYFSNTSLCPSHLRNITEYFFINFKELSIALIKEHLSAIPIDPMKLLFVMRIIFYTVSNAKDERLYILNPPHTDKSYFSLLPQATNSGLQYKDNGKWKDLSYNDQEILIISGTKLSFYHFVPLEHRVINYNYLGNRIAVAFFIS